MLLEAKGGDTAEMLNTFEELFEEIALLIERLGKAMLFVVVGFVGYIRRRVCTAIRWRSRLVS